MAGLPAGSSRGERLDPLTLPVRFVAPDAAADERSRVVRLDRERVLVERSVRGVRMRLALPVDAYLGVAIRLVPPQDDNNGALAIVLEHKDSALSVPLQVTDRDDHLIADWRLWGRVLRRRLLVADADGSLRDAFPTLGECEIDETASRRMRRTPLKGRRTKIGTHRALAHRALAPIVHRGEREIIAPE